MIVVETGRMDLIALTQEQLSDALHNIDRLAADLHAEISPGVFSEESRQAMMIKISRMEHADRRLHQWYTYFLLIRKQDSRAIGVCGFKGPPTMFGTVELGYAIQESYRNQGMMTEAVRALVDWAFTDLTCRRVTAETLRENYPSQRVLQKSGLLLDRGSENMLFWKLDREEWEEHKNGASSKGAGKPTL